MEAQPAESAIHEELLDLQAQVNTRQNACSSWQPCKAASCNCNLQAQTVQYQATCNA